MVTMSPIGPQMKGTCSRGAPRLSTSWFSVAEAQACGTPVIAFDRGSMCELIEHERTGFVVDGVDAAVSAVDSLAGSV
jgi:glycosyltransferase involved in cell wall biosynthesis